MKLTKEEKEKVEQFLFDKIKKECPMCGSHNLGIKQTYDLSLVSLDESENGSIHFELNTPFEAGVLRMVGITCNNCHHLMFFELGSILREK